MKYTAPIMQRLAQRKSTRERFLHVEVGKDREHDDRNHLLQHLELGQAHGPVTGAIGGYLKAVLKNAIPQLTKIAIHRGLSRKLRR